MMPSPLSHQFDQLLEQELDRREFLAYAGATLLAMIGVSGLLKNLGVGTTSASPKSANTYGSSTYGGNR